ncbi:hypothetical protein [Chitinophaga ginsengisegetis]|uniref:hypothetical protein n=1 Tax=Chitinophaga ginsengisegetis TaxID=393003 RepID=UPI000DBACF77|nr:hypothetical protein [Chitinophaga ginsengisegetis]MDR6566090.1 hypothetical protein [Chitinophaga ginsengisegetis]MDR6645819.1 hypothetical protein [Chitinophaga ginsengisegetis]MDR6651589.1 hypothetical protein [Chitinophaga ginsengisegetis]
MKYLPFLLLLFLSACIGITRQQNVTATAVRDTISPDISSLINLYQTFEQDTLEILPGAYGDPGSWHFGGTAIDSQLQPLLSDRMYNKDYLFYACYKFNLDPNTIGLVTRAPSEYESSSVKLFAYHKQTNTITFETELAEEFGDAGDVLIKNSWLYHSPDSSWRVILENFSSSQYGTPEDTVATESYDYYHLSWNGNKIDTVSTDSSALVRVYKTMTPVRKK